MKEYFLLWIFGKRKQNWRGQVALLKQKGHCWPMWRAVKEQKSWLREAGEKAEQWMEGHIIKYGPCCSLGRYQRHFFVYVKKKLYNMKWNANANAWKDGSHYKGRIGAQLEHK